jgi:hypothetical protein
MQPLTVFCGTLVGKQGFSHMLIATGYAKITSFKLNTGYTTKERESVHKFGISHSYAIF